MQQRLRLEEKQLTQKRRAEDQRRHEEEREFQLMKEREHQDMIFQQQLEHAHHTSRIGSGRCGAK